MNNFPRYLVLTSLSVAIALGSVGCKSNQTPANTNQAQDQNPSQDPAVANVAPISNASTQPTGYDQSAPAASNSYPQSAPASSSPGDRRRSDRDRSDRDRAAGYSDQYPSDQYSSDDYNNPDYYNNYDNYDQPVDYASQAPPPLPEYDQPPCPGDDYIWTPGYWNYASDGYYWVPGAWVSAPYQGALWTPGYWDYDHNHNRYGLHMFTTTR
jgi:hypothetical protein